MCLTYVIITHPMKYGLFYKLLKIWENNQTLSSAGHPDPRGGHGNSPGAADAFSVGQGNLVECKQKKAAAQLTFTVPAQ